MNRYAWEPDYAVEVHLWLPFGEPAPNEGGPSLQPYFPQPMQIVRHWYQGDLYDVLPHIRHAQNLESTYWIVLIRSSHRDSLRFLEGQKFRFGVMLMNDHGSVIQLERAEGYLSEILWVRGGSGSTR